MGYRVWGKSREEGRGERARLFSLLTSLPSLFALLLWPILLSCRIVPVLPSPPPEEPAACTPPPAVPPSCNGSIDLCARPYNNVAYATSHNAMSNREDDFVAPNQNLSVPDQLASGVRALMLDTHDFEGVPHLCHGFCEAGRKPLTEGLFEIAEFLRCNPAEVVTLIFESNITPEATLASFEESGLLAYLYPHTDGEPWPTLGEMIDADTRLVVFTDSGGGAFEGYHDLFQFAWEVPFSAAAPEDFTCDEGRGSRPDDLFIFNHFLTGPIGGDEALAETVNFNPMLLDRALECQAIGGQIPNFVTLDFVDIGDLLEVVDVLNGI